MSTIEIRVPQNLGKILKGEVSKYDGHEHLVFALVTHAITKDRILVLVRDIFPLPDASYIPASGHGAKWRGASTIDIINRAMSSSCGIFLFHSHGSSPNVTLSPDDLQSAYKLLPTYQNLIPERPHGSIVLGENCMDGMILMPGQVEKSIPQKVRWFNHRIEDWYNSRVSRASRAVDPFYQSQLLLVHEDGQKILENSKIAVVGLSGGGSHVVQQLTHLGIGEIIGIDPDYSERKNRHRVIGMTRMDAFLKRKKTGVMNRLARRVNNVVKFTPVPALVTDQIGIDNLKRADVVVGCVDNWYSRDDINVLCLRYEIPYVDIGLDIVPNQSGDKIRGIGGSVVSTIPGRMCLWCAGRLSKNRLEAETGGRPRSYMRGKQTQAQVVSFNGALASMAVNEVLQLLVGYAPKIDEGLSFKKFDGFANTIEKWLIKSVSKCSVCDSAMGAGDQVWQAVG